jgi:hypothetical protein
MIDTSGLAGYLKGEVSLFLEQLSHTGVRVEVLLLGIVTSDMSRTFDVRVRSVVILSRLWLMSCLSKA